MMNHVLDYEMNSKLILYSFVSGIALAVHSYCCPYDDRNAGSKKPPKPNFWGKFCRQKSLGKFWQWGVKTKSGCSGFAISFFSEWGVACPHNEKIETANPEHPNFFKPLIAKISSNFSVNKISSKSLVWVFFSSSSSFGRLYGPTVNRFR